MKQIFFTGCALAAMAVSGFANSDSTPSSAHAWGNGNNVWVQNSKYWSDGKAEFDIYDAELKREGVLQHGKVRLIFVREPFDPKQLVKADDWKKPGMIHVLKMNEIIEVPTGLYVSQQMLSYFWRVSDGRLLKYSLTFADSCGNSFKIGTRIGDTRTWDLRAETYWDGMSKMAQKVQTAPFVFYDELPMRVRSIDFSKPSGKFTARLAKSVIGSKAHRLEISPAQVSYDVGKKQITVSVTHDGGKDTFTLARKSPHLLLEWKMADGGSLTLKRALKIAYWKYGRPGGKEKALNDASAQLYPAPEAK